MASSISAVPVTSSCNHASYLRAGKEGHGEVAHWPVYLHTLRIRPSTLCITTTRSRSIDRWQPPPALIERASY
ncbi:hypothetical protein GQ55_5G525800 [Panicum hallii var. hallii]|uniref:Uncharacterized protein n=1 Tax=Panicum hallii var. hallii TaxID=1504633 RepID=A0A2T7DSU4_9POAL|nr:hypothetical protein GQ55_5G525800 [Panicum hallii var. hallii]